MKKMGRKGIRGKFLNRYGQRLRREGQRLAAVLMCASLVVGNLSTSAFHALADSNTDNEYTYEIEKTALQAALQTAVSEGNTVNEDLEFDGEHAEEYAQLLEADGTLYELELSDDGIDEDDDRDKALNLRIFARIEGDIPLDETYEIDGSEEIVFLLSNKTEETVTATISVDGLETDAITILPADSIPVDEESTAVENVEAVTNAISSGVSTGGGGSGGSSGSSAAAAEATEGTEDEIEIAITDSVDEYESEGESITEDSSVSILDEDDGDSSISADIKDEDASGHAEADDESSGEEAADNQNSDSETGDTDSKSADAGSEDASDKNANAGDTGEAGNTENNDTDNNNTDSSDSKTGDTGSDDNADSSADAADADEGAASDTEDADSSDDTADAESGNNESANDTADGSNSGSADDTSGNDSSSDITEDSDVSVLGSAISIHKSVLLAASIATDSDADEEASASDADKAVDGIVYESVRFDKKGAAAFATTAADLKMDEIVYVEYSAEENDVIVTVTAPSTALPSGAELSVTLYDEDSEEYAAAAEAIDYTAEEAATVAEDTDSGEEAAEISSEEIESDTSTASMGLAVLDISFLVDGEEVEPTEAVTVSIDASGILPEDADAGTIEVQHLTESGDGLEATLVADAEDQSDGTVDTDSVVAEFEVESFSTFTITWSSGNGGPDGQQSGSVEITATTYLNGTDNIIGSGNKTLTGNSGEAYDLTSSNSELEIDGYTLVSATVTYGDDTYDATAVTVTITSGSGNGGNNTRYTCSYTDSSGTVTNLYYNQGNAQTVTVSLYYVEDAGITITAEGSDKDGYTLTANIKGSYSYSDKVWTINNDSVAELTENNDGTVTVQWKEDVKTGDTVIVTVTSTCTNYFGVTETVTDSYVLIYDSSKVTFTVNYSYAATSTNNGTTTTTNYTGLATDTTVYVYDTSGNLIASGTTDNNGNVTFDLADGTDYIIVAEYTTGNYTMYCNETVTADATSGNTVTLSSAYYYHIDLRVEGTFEITVTDTDTEETNVTITKIWDDNDNTGGTRPDSIDVYIKDESGDIVNTITLYEASGWTYTWENVDLSDGMYTVSEENVDGYTLSNDSVDTFVIDKTGDGSNDSDSVTYTGSITVKELNSLTIIKDGESYSVEVNGTVKTDDNNETSYEYQSVAGHGTGGVAPTSVLTDIVTVQDGDVIVVEVTYEYSYSYTYPDDDGIEQTATITGETTTKIYITVDEDANICEGSKWTDQYGYDFKISAEELLNSGEVLTTYKNATLTNTLDEETTTDLAIIKMEAGNDEIYLAGAEFYLYYIDGNITYYYSCDVENNKVEWVTDKDKATVIETYSDKASVVEDLTLGTYYLEEITAPDGYNLLSAPIEFTLDAYGLTLYLTDDGDASGDVDDDGNPILYVYNSKGSALPETGGPGTIPFRIAGLLLTSCSAYLIYETLRRKKNCLS